MDKSVANVKKEKLQYSSPKSTNGFNKLKKVNSAAKTTSQKKT